MSKTLSIPIWQEGRNTCIRLQIIPGAPKDSLHVSPNLVIEVHIKAKAEAGKANSRLLTFLSQKLALPETSIAIRQGHTSRKKLVVIKEIDATLVLNAFGIPSI